MSLSVFVNVKNSYANMSHPVESPHNLVSPTSTSSPSNHQNPSSPSTHQRTIRESQTNGVVEKISKDGTLLLPKFKKNQRNIPHHQHDWCCPETPPGRKEHENNTKIVTRNAVNLHAFASVNMGTRDHMEDRHRIHYGTNGLYNGFFGVFDGHGGEEASHYTHEHLHLFIQEEIANQLLLKRQASKEKQMNAHPTGTTDHLTDSKTVHNDFINNNNNNNNSNVKTLENTNILTPVTPPASGLHLSKNPTENKYLALDEKKLDDQLLKKEDLSIDGTSIEFRDVLLRAFDRLEHSVLSLSKRVGCRDGTTVTCVFIANGHIYCANTGDSRTVLCRGGTSVALSTDHKPCLEDERERIIKAGGEVRSVMIERKAFCCFKAKSIPHGAERLWPGGFSVSRAIGDIDYKDIRRKKSNVVNVLIHTPDITVMPIVKQDYFIVLASDGLWDVMTNAQVCDFVLKELKKRKAHEPLDDLSQKLADKAFSLGSEDNVTVVIVFFPNHDLPFKQ